ncbi:hypothetical protein OEV98_13705 [Caldibacillus lycopersici]|uniref:Uncharacterized protein n=1 Tax=Perspicuibacillus lycopersici TaxID=1325689 RepID=A0AAE3IX94_9BACI|nr:hypothetical protein [Perspicuibacillus lycopersici]MCU9614594.1 hypothetical protein [Perspicuibacillus lycopersici]
MGFILFILGIPLIPSIFIQIGIKRKHVAVKTIGNIVLAWICQILFIIAYGFYLASLGKNTSAYGWMLLIYLFNLPVAPILLIFVQLLKKMKK